MARTIYMIHGMWGGAWHWDNYRRVFEAAGYRCVVTTLPYHAAAPSAPPDPRLGTTGLRDYVDALAREIEQLDETPIIMGHSMGGLLAQLLGERGLARALVLLTPASPSGIIAITPSVLRSFTSIMTTWGFWRKPVRQTFGEAAYSVLQLLPESEQRKVYENCVPESGRAVFEIGFWPLDGRRAARVDATRVTCPVLVVAGALDRITPTSVVRKVARKYGAPCKVFADHAHWVLGEPRWEDVAEYVRTWLDALPADSVS